jgi:CubicO group peptidase (beta-lactamase class C family)
MSDQRTGAENGMTRRAWLATSGAAALSACAATASSLQGTPSTLNPQPSTLAGLSRWMRIASVPGVSIAIVDRGRTTTHGFGVTRAGGNDAVNGDTVFEAASLSKPVFAYVVLQLAAENVIDLDKPLGEYLPLPNASDEAARTITARHVLSHTTGWRNWRFARDHTLTADFTPRLSLRLLGRRLLLPAAGRRTADREGNPPPHARARLRAARHAP